MGAFWLLKPTNIPTFSSPYKYSYQLNCLSYGYYIFKNGSDTKRNYPIRLKCHPNLNNPQFNIRFCAACCKGRGGAVEVYQDVELSESHFTHFTYCILCLMLVGLFEYDSLLKYYYWNIHKYPISLITIRCIFKNDNCWINFKINERLQQKIHVRQSCQIQNTIHRPHSKCICTYISIFSLFICVQCVHRDDAVLMLVYPAGRTHHIYNNPHINIHIYLHSHPPTSNNTPPPYVYYIQNNNNIWHFRSHGQLRLGESSCIVLLFLRGLTQCLCLYLNALSLFLPSLLSTLWIMSKIGAPSPPNMQTALCISAHTRSVVFYMTLTKQRARVAH